MLVGDVAGAVGQHPVPGALDPSQCVHPGIDVTRAQHLESSCKRGGAGAPSRPARAQVQARIVRVAVKYAMVVFIERQHYVRVALACDHLGSHLKRLPAVLARHSSAVGAVAAVLDPRVDGVHAAVRRTPRELARAPGGRGRKPRDRPHDREAVIELDHRLVPEGGQPVDLQVRVIGQDRPAAACPCAADHPVVGSQRSRQPHSPSHAVRDEPLAQTDPAEQLDVEPFQPPREQVLQPLARYALLHHLHQQTLHIGLVLRELHVAHGARDRDRVRDRPRLRPVANQPELPRDTLVERRVDARAVRLHARTILGTEFR